MEVESEALQARNLATAVHESTSALDQLHRYLEQFLAVRVEAYPQQGKATTEIQESNSDMRKVLNNGEGGYLNFRYNPLTDTLFYLSNEAHPMLEKRSCELRTEYNGGVELARHLDACYVLNK
ncbi:hypothetical protein BDB00DRAFT_875282 [Zychaea mexicana]|uniref:uncharacterized protein n=1 Tax=Zychaea mexicana TaxID=64656 RepID=UPI0022FEDCD5|nr:uncharacterized protein BDB00DRAFT_875282 [Zychaea mexicana]KAI9490549.1 hypothetical protein BDB00DRAFT_875282 [Zychaea mexicana]